MKHTTLPTPLVVSYTLFLALLVPIYWYHYGWTNFLYFCDIALFLTAYGIWRKSALAVSMAAVGILLPQALWCADYAWQWWLEMQSLPHKGMTAYMFDAQKPLHLRALSLFHGWLPFLLLYLVKKLGYDHRALLRWTALMIVLCLFSYFYLPAAGAPLLDPNTPRNVNYVYGLDDALPQSWLPAPAYLLSWMLALFTLIYLPTHALLKSYFLKSAVPPVV